MKIKVNKLKAKDVYLDTDKFLDLNYNKNQSKFFRHWYRYSFTLTPLIGSNQVLSLFDGITIPTKIIPSVGLRAGQNKRVDIILPRSIDTFHDESAEKTLANHLKDTARIYRMSLPRKSQHFLNKEKYPNGSEFNWSTKDFIIFSLGLNIPTCLS